MLPSDLQALGTLQAKAPLHMWIILGGFLAASIWYLNFGVAYFLVVLVLAIKEKTAGKKILIPDNQDSKPTPSAGTVLRVFLGVLLVAIVWFQGIILRVAAGILLGHDCHSFVKIRNSSLSGYYPLGGLFFLPLLLLFFVLINYQMLRRLVRTPPKGLWWVVTVIVAIYLSLVSASLIYGGSPLADHYQGTKYSRWEGYEWKWLGVEEWHEIALPSPDGTVLGDCN